MNPELLDYIKKCREQGISDEQVKTKLKDAGFADTEIGEALGAPTTPAVSNNTSSDVKGPNKSKKIIIISVVAVVIIAIIILILTVFMKSGDNPSTSVADLLKQSSNSNNNNNVNKNTNTPVAQRPVIMIKDCGQSGVLDLSSNLSIYADEAALTCMGEVLLGNCKTGSYGLINTGSGSDNVSIASDVCTIRVGRWCPKGDIDSKITTHQASGKSSAEFFLGLYSECKNKLTG